MKLVKDLRVSTANASLPLTPVSKRDGVDMTKIGRIVRIDLVVVVHLERVAAHCLTDIAKCTGKC